MNPLLGVLLCAFLAVCDHDCGEMILARWNLGAKGRLATASRLLSAG